MKDAKKILEKSIKEHQKAIDKAKKEMEALEVTYSIGDRFYYGERSRTGKRFLVETKDDCCAMISFYSGCFANDNIVAVGNKRKITQDELEKLCDGNGYVRYWDSRKEESV